MTHVRLGRTQLELNQTNLRLLDSVRSARTANDSLVQSQSIDQLGVINRSSDLLDDSDVSKIHVRSFRRHQCRDGLYGDGSEHRRVLRDDLRVQTGAGSSEKVLLVVQIYWGRHVGEIFYGLGGGLLERLGDNSGVDSYPACALDSGHT